MNDFLKSLTAFGMEGMNAEVESVDAYAGSEVAEELIELDNIEAQTVAMESMSDAIMEGALEMQTIALEAAGLDLGTASNFSGELSTEAIANMAKRGYYEVKIQVKKAIQKIWKLILSIVDNLLGSEGRLKSYGKLFKKYNERLSKINPKDKKDGDERDIAIRNWSENGIVGTLQQFKMVANGDLYKGITRMIKATNPKDCIDGVLDTVKVIRVSFYKFLRKHMGSSKEDAVKATADFGKMSGMLSKAVAEELEKKVEESMKDLDMKDKLQDIIEDIKDVDTDEVPILTAKANLLAVGRALENECKKDLKFKKDLIRLRKAWDKKTGEWNLKDMEEGDVKDATAAILRTLNKFGPIITGFRLGLSKVYSAIASNLQGVLADMAKVIAKGTNIGA